MMDFSNMLWVMWLIIAGTCFIIEIINIGFLMFWFGVGALLAMITSFFTDNVIIQTSVFVISSTILLFFTRPLANKFAKSDDKNKTNAYSIVGKKGLVITDIDPISGQGQIKIGTETWSAKSLDDQKIEKGTQIEVVKIDGVKAIVK